MTKQQITVIKKEKDLINEKEFDISLKQQFGENYKDFFEIVIVNEEEAGIKWLKDVDPAELKKLEEKKEQLALKLNKKNNNELLSGLCDFFNSQQNMKNRKTSKKNLVLMKDRKGNSAFRKGSKSRSKY